MALALALLALLFAHSVWSKHKEHNQLVRVTARPQWEFMSHLQHEETVMSAVPAGEPRSHAAMNNAACSIQYARRLQLHYFTHLHHKCFDLCINGNTQ